MESPAAQPDPNAPIAQFSQCHTGILSHLDEFALLPALLDPAVRARQIAASMLAFFRTAVFEHHREEEDELFPAVLASAQKGDEHELVRAIVARLTREHRDVEKAWTELEPALKKIAKGSDVTLDGNAVTALVRVYHGHASYEEKEFLPLAQVVLGRNANHMAALGLSLHMRHTMPDTLKRYSSFI